MKIEPISVVVVESQSLMRAALSTTLSAEGFNVLAELSGNTLMLKKIKHLSPDLILFSINRFSLVDLKKITVIHRELPSTRILALITGEFRGQEQAALDHGAHAVLNKSAHRSDLLNVIRQLKTSQLVDSLSIH